MLLQRLQLNNIRSYNDLDLPFPEGSLLLSGDIGSGKSSILLAIEFALFGASRTHLPGEALLRKGTTQASVTLTFTINELQVTIQRNLKKSKVGVKQVAGHIIADGIKKELTAVEMKAEIINLLNYPQEAIGKEKNYLFRYTVYTPQEEMKFILQEHKQTRLNVLRKIFNMDKYTLIRDNLHLYLKGLRTRITILETTIKPLPEQEQLLDLQDNELKRITELIKQLDEVVRKKKKELLEQRQHNDELDRQIKQQQEVLNIIATKQAVLEEKETYLKQLEEQAVILTEKKKEMPKELTKDMVVNGMKQLEEHKRQLLQRETILQSQEKNILEKLKHQEEEISKMTQEIANLDIKKKQIEHLNQAIAEQEPLLEKKQILAEQIEKATILISRSQMLLQQAKERSSNISGITNCPNCLQEVSESYKEKIIEEENIKIKKIVEILTSSEKKRTELQQELAENDKKTKIIAQQNILLVKYQSDVEQTEVQKVRFEELKRIIKENRTQLNLIVSDLKESDFGQQIASFGVRIEEQQTILSALVEQEQIQKQILMLDLQLQETKMLVTKLKEQLITLQETANRFIDIKEIAEEAKKKLNVLLEEEKALLVKQAEQLTKQEHLKEQTSDLSEIISNLKKEKSHLLRCQEINHWLEKFLIQLTYTIEKQVMLHVHRQFDQLFQEWFATLIEDQSMYARIDDAFTPVIEQNGYEVAFNHLSGGEKTSAALAYRLALNQVINDIVHQVKTKDVLILDEPTDGFSHEQLDKVRDVLERLNLKQIILVSHEPKIESFVEHVIHIRKEEHQSCIF